MMAQTLININGDVRDASSLTVPADRTFRGAWTFNGDAIEIDPVKQREIFVREVKAEARRRIEAAWPIYKQLNLQAEGGQAFIDMRAEIDAIRARSDVLEVGDILDPITLRADATWAAS